MFEIGVKKVKIFEVGPRDGLQMSPILFLLRIKSNW